MVVPRCERSGEIIEPMLTDQWFVAMTKPAPDTHPYFPGKSFQDICLQRSTRPPDRRRRAGAIRFVPEHWTSTYNHWLDNVQDWCISRQLWWGHRIPAWYDEAGNVYVARNDAEARAQGAGKLGREPSLRAGRRRARHLVLVGAVVPLDARLAGGDARAAHVPADRRCWSPASTSSSSGSRA